MGVASRLRPSRYWLLPLLGAAVAGIVITARTRPVEVAAAPVSSGPVAEEAAGTGTLESEATVSVAFTIPGRISKILVQEGQRVRAGEALSELDPEEQDRHLTTARRGVDLAASGVARAEAEVTRARVTREGAIRDRKRAEALFSAGAVSEAERDLAIERADRADAELAAIAATRQGTGAVAVARATAAVEARRSAETTVTSPFDGIVVRRVREPGDVVSPGAPVLVIASTRKIWARTWLDETVIQKLREGQSARVSLRGSPEKTLEARVDRVAVEADRQTHEVLVDLELLGLPDRLVLGQRADGFVTLASVPSSLRIPQGACDVAGSKCPVERGGKVAYVDVSFGLRGTDWIEVRSGLSDGDMVLLSEPGSAAPPAGRSIKTRAGAPAGRGAP